MKYHKTVGFAVLKDCIDPNDPKTRAGLAALFGGTPVQRLTTVERMRARRKLWSAGRYLEDQYNKASRGAYSVQQEALEQLARWEAILLLAQLYNGFVAN